MKWSTRPTPASRSASAKLPISRNMGALRAEFCQITSTTRAFSQAMRVPEEHSTMSQGLTSRGERESSGGNDPRMVLFSIAPPPPLAHAVGSGVSQLGVTGGSSLMVPPV